MTAPGLPLSAGAAGDAVRDLQDRLAALGLDCTADDPGCFGDATAAAVVGFQHARGLRGDGVVGSQTWSTLVEAGYRLGDRLLYHTSPMLRGDDVAELQRRLGSLGFDAGRVDGIFGPDTAGALSEFQRNCGLTVDGISGPDTVAALLRLGQRTVVNEPVGHILQREALRRAPRTLSGRKVVVGDGGGLGALAEAVGRALAVEGAVPLVLHDPDDSLQARQANEFDAEVFVGLRTRLDDDVRCSLAYYGRSDWESVGGKRLAQLMSAHVPGAIGAPLPDPPQTMTVPLLRETRMPAVVLEVGPPATVVQRAAELARAVADAVSHWATSPEPAEDDRSPAEVG